MMGITTPYTFILVATATMNFLLAAYLWKQRRTPMAYPFIGLMLATTFHSFGYAFELASRRLEGMLFWTHIEYIGISAIPLFWLVLTSRYTGRDKWLTRPVLAVLSGFSALTLILNWTSSSHRLFYRSVGVNTDGPFPTFSFARGPWYWAHHFYINLALIIGTILLIQMFVRSSSAYRRQAALMLIGGAFPWIGYMIYLSGVVPYNIDVTPFGMAITGPIFIMALFRFRLLDLVPIARDAVFLGMGEGVIVVDGLNRIVDYNPSAQCLFPVLDPGFIGRAAVEVLGPHPAVLKMIFSGSQQTAEILIEHDGQAHYYAVRLSSLAGRDGKAIGRALLFSDTTVEAELREKLRIQATIDELTGAVNRRQFTEIGNREMARSKRSGHALSFIIIDLDRFKIINDSWGHEAGDSALREAAARFRSQLRTADSLGRHGGEEFAILLPETLPAQAHLVAERLRTALNASPIRLRGGAEVALTASIGVSGVERVREETLEDFIRAADRAMYQAKTEGRNRIHLAAGVTSTPP